MRSTKAAKIRLPMKGTAIDIATIAVHGSRGIWQQSDLHLKVVPEVVVHLAAHRHLRGLQGIGKSQAVRKQHFFATYLDERSRQAAELGE